MIISNYYDPVGSFDLDEQVIIQEFVENDENELDSFERNALGFHLAGKLEYFKDPSKYMPEIDDDIEYNKTTVRYYYWQERCEINHISEIVDIIRAEKDIPLYTKKKSKCTNK